ncbi:deoxyribodipyrimidine photo-lyase [bacterium]|nr:deoxyribodipyrimidine photo-lyase [candidate division CSSED10-310 bacterium]
MIDCQERIHIVSNKTLRSGPVIYWMSRDQRADDNWALLYAWQQSRDRKVPLHVVFSVTRDFLNATHRHFYFMLKGLQEVEFRLHEKGIPFHLLSGSPDATIPDFVKMCGAGLLVCDFDPLTIKKKWISNLCDRLPVAIHEVDTHNIVPCRVAYPDRAAIGAYVIRRPIINQLHLFMSDFPNLPKQRFAVPLPINDWTAHFTEAKALGGRELPEHIKPGYSAGMAVLDTFIGTSLDYYETHSRNPAVDGQSRLSPYLHFGQLAPQRVALRVSRAQSPGVNSFLEQCIVRRELSDNWCLNTPGYDSIRAFPAWARKTLDDHQYDPRSYLYSIETYEAINTHDPIWNAAQREMMILGTMHGYLRMYWAKKILEWSPDPETALATAIYLNDRYSLDGRDPNGYAGLAWSIGGVHDRPWAERPVFGKIRYMNERGARRKFDMNAYIDRIDRRIESLTYHR